VLDVGAGSGAFSKRLEDAGFQVVATDLDPAQDWMKKLDLARFNPDEFGGPIYDLVTCVETLEHLENPRGALKSLRSLLRPGGHIVISTPNVTHPHSRLMFLWNSTFFTFGREAYYSTGHISLLPDWLLVEHLRQSGYEVSAVEYAGFAQLGRMKRLVYRIGMGLFRLFGIKQPRTSGEGLCLFVTAMNLG
jgi:SAM-dependent methyltransferase